jgi:hypothetical protein
MSTRTLSAERSAKNRAGSTSVAWRHKPDLRIEPSNY